MKVELDVNFAKAFGPDYWEKQRNVFGFRLSRNTWLNAGKLAEYVGDDPVTIKGPAVQVTTNPALPSLPPSA